MYTFGTRGVWHAPASETQKAMDFKCTVLEHLPHGVLYIFTDKPIVRGSNNLTHRTATIFPSDFAPEK